jgi:hypothetical protein
LNTNALSSYVIPETLDGDEITWKQLRIEQDHTLGSGRFAHVFKGYIIREKPRAGGERETYEVPVAVKMSKEFAERAAFEREIELMRQIGRLYLE